METLIAWSKVNASGVPSVIQERLQATIRVETFPIRITDITCIAKYGTPLNCATSFSALASLPIPNDHVGAPLIVPNATSNCTLVLHFPSPISIILIIYSYYKNV